MSRLAVLAMVPAIILAVAIIPALMVKPAEACYSPHITGNISRTDVNINETVTVMGRICPPADNVSIRVTFTRPDYSWLDRWTLTDNKTGEFAVTQTLDMAGYWNIFPIYGHMCDRLSANVTDPNALVIARPNLPPNKVNYSVLTASAVIVSVGLVALVTGARKKTRNISSLRLFVQIAFIFILFVGIFIDHQNLPWPAEQISPHEVLVGNNAFGVAMPDGLPVPTFGCYYPCGRTVTCALWQIQAYIYPFWNAGRGWGVNYDSTGIARLAIVFGGVILAAVILGRLWCGWVCPFGLYMDLVTRVRKAFNIKHRSLSDNANAKLHQLSYVILAVIIIVSVLFASQAIAGTQLVSGTEQGGFVNTYFAQPFCQVCPMKPLCILAEGSVGIIRFEWILGPTTGQFYQLGWYLTSINLLGLGLVTVTGFLFRRSWCRICPLGGLIALFNRFPPFKWVSGVRLHKVEEKCTKCGICKRVCPTQVKEVYEFKGGDVTTSNCILCLRCVEMCPEEGCLNFKMAGKTAFKSRNWLEDTPVFKSEKND
jgi:ferredoxin-type protein NapH